MRPGTRNVFVFLIGISITLNLLNTCEAQDKTAEITELMNRIYDNGQFYGTIIIAVDGKVIYKNANGLANLEWEIPHTIDTKFRIASVTKPFTAMLILQLVQEGQLKLNGKLTDYLPEFPEEKGKDITVHQLLTHTGGIVGEPKIPDLDDIERLYYPKERLLKYISEKELSYKPGRGREYSNFGYFLLGMVIEKVSGKSYEQLLQEKICNPAGMKNTIPDVNVPLIDKRASGYHYDYFTGPQNAPYLDMSFAFSCGHLLSTVEDLYRFNMALYTEKLLTKKYRDMFFNRYGWFYQRTPVGKKNKRVRASYLSGSINGFASHILRIEKDRIFIGLLKNMKERNGQIVIKWPEFITSRILAILYDLEYDLPKKSAAYAVFQTMVKSGIQAAHETYQDINKNRRNEYYFQKEEFDMLREKLAEKKKLKEASEFSKLGSQ